MKKKLKSVNIWQSHMVTSLWPRFLAHPVLLLEAEMTLKVFSVMNISNNAIEGAT